MSDLYSKICDDIQRYVAMCDFYGETVQYDKPTEHTLACEDCYGEHADRLLARAEKEGKLFFGTFHA